MSVGVTGAHWCLVALWALMEARLWCTWLGPEDLQMSCGKEAGSYKPLDLYLYSLWYEGPFLKISFVLVTAVGIRALSLLPHRWTQHRRLLPELYLWHLLPKLRQWLQSHSRSVTMQGWQQHCLWSEESASVAKWIWVEFVFYHPEITTAQTIVILLMSFWKTFGLFGSAVLCK